MVLDAAGVPLADAIAGLRSQLIEAMDRGGGSKVAFLVAPIELTLQAQITAGGHGGVKWWVVEAGGKAERVATQTIKLTLDPRLMTRGGDVSDQSVHLDGKDT